MNSPAIRRMVYEQSAADATPREILARLKLRYPDCPLLTCDIYNGRQRQRHDGVLKSRIELRQERAKRQQKCRASPGHHTVNGRCLFGWSKEDLQAVGLAMLTTERGNGGGGESGSGAGEAGRVSEGDDEATP
ncbi:MAG: hypothetical protein M1838_004262 [Thelocarpon superellum]|nr:MAG: hypothetical protein M1838_004262 [Thelocarpon superellum]